MKAPTAAKKKLNAIIEAEGSEPRDPDDEEEKEEGKFGY